MKIDLSCPVELWRYTTPGEGSPECTFALNNLSDKVVISVQMALVCNAADGAQIFRQAERFQGLNASPGERFSVSVTPMQWESAYSIEVIIEKVWYDDATIWRRGAVHLTAYESNALPPGRKLDQLRFVAGPDAVGYPSLQNRVWVCVCGRANALTSERCCRCERRRDTVFATCSRENVDQLIAVHEQKLISVAKAAREDTSRLAEEREKLRQKALRKKRTLRLLATLGSVTAVLLLAVVLWGVPALRYANADALLESGQFDAAREAYEALGNYADAQTQVNQCDYRKAESLAQADDADGLKAAAVLYDKLGGYLDSRARYQQSVYRMGTLALEAGRYDHAAEAFMTLGDYQDSQTQLLESQYRQADKLFAEESHIAARILFEDLGDYRDASARVAACDFALGQAALAQGDYQSAVDKLTAAGEVDGAEALLKQASYLRAEELLAAGELARAGIYYQQAGDYADAALKANGTLYEQAKAHMAAGDFASAQELYTRISGYLDSETLAWEAVYRRALQLYNAGDDDGAIDLLITIPKHTKGAELLQMSRYRKAGTLAAAGDNDGAATLYALLGTYQDAVTLLRDARYQLAEAAFSTGDYETAAPLYELLGRYRDSADKYKQSRYHAANEALAAKDYTKAIEGFTALGAYQDSAALLMTATYELALSLKTSGDVSQALSLLASLPDYADARAQLSEITMSEAVKAQAAGELEKASELYLALGDYGDAKENYNACQYELAMRKMEAQDYRGAAPMFEALGDYQDAAALAETCIEEAYGRYALPARAAMETKAWKTVIQILADFDDTDLPAAYADLTGMYEEACYQYAEELYAADQPYEALVYYQLIPTYRDVATRKLTRRAYLILGIWENADGQKTATFRQDGICTVFGETRYFRVDGYGLWTGTQADALTLTHKLTTLTEEALSIRVLADRYNAVYPLRRVGDAAAAMALEVEIPEPADDFIVAEDAETTQTSDAPAQTPSPEPASQSPAESASPAPATDVPAAATPTGKRGADASAAA